jgi:putative transposase
MFSKAALRRFLVDRDSYLLELCRYVVLNPVWAKTTRKAETYPLSSYRATGGLASVPTSLTIDWLLSQFGRQRVAAQRKYQTFVAEGMGQGSPWEEVRGQVLLGSERFIKRLAPGLQDMRVLKEIPRRQRFAARPPLGQLFGARTRTDRVRWNEAICRAHLDHGYSLTEIGRAVGLHYATISRIANLRDRD